MQQGPIDPNGWGAVTGQPLGPVMPPPPAPADGISTAPLANGQSWYWSWARVAGPPLGFAFHGVLFLGNMVLLIVIYVIAILTCGVGVLLYVINLSIPFVSAGYGFYLAFKARDGGWHKYPIAGDKVWAMNKPLIP